MSGCNSHTLGDLFSVISSRGYSYNLLNTYLLFLSQDDKEKLKELGIIFHSPTFKKRLFNYPDLLKPFRGIKSKKITFLEKYEEKVSLNELTMGTNYSFSHLLPMSKIILDHPELISDLKKPTSSRQSLTNLIHSQSQLLSLKVYKTPIAIENLPNSLISIKFETCNFAAIMPFDGFKSLKQLRSLQFINCIGLTIQNFQPLLNNPSPLKLRSFKGVGLIPGIAVLIQLVVVASKRVTPGAATVLLEYL
ncbi:4815_t:CDS:2 [Funneliformis mosseae]|uniref:4815_t:CDS:1 n=1 Tax=Funneliformis mosseae TaxID=27381 RepID=A0A9N9CME9_FUNMO|nr:4815_t:CDS:2 [Funneliformis mosseae]